MMISEDILMKNSDVNRTKFNVELFYFYLEVC